MEDKLRRIWPVLFCVGITMFIWMAIWMERSPVASIGSLLDFDVTYGTPETGNNSVIYGAPEAGNNSVTYGAPETGNNSPPIVVRNAAPVTTGNSNDILRDKSTQIRTSTAETSWNHVMDGSISSTILASPTYLTRRDKLHREGTTNNKSHPFLPDRNESPSIMASQVSATNASEASNSQHEATNGSHLAQLLLNWVNVTGEMCQMYLLSAFYDDRWSDASRPVISVLAVLEIPDVQNLTHVSCVVYCQSGKPCWSTHTLADNAVSGSGIIHSVRLINNRRYIRAVIGCKLDNTCQKPVRVTLTYHNSSTSHRESLDLNETAINNHPESSLVSHLLSIDSTIAVVYPDKVRRHEFGVCVPVMFGCLEPTRIVEWMEMQMVLGVTKVVLYNNSLCTTTSDVIRHYVRQGFVELIHNTPVFTTFTGIGHVPVHRDEIRMRAPLLLNDCLYRHMYNFRYVILSDLDELIIPQKSDDLFGMLKDVSALDHNAFVHMASTAFTNFYFLMNNTIDADYKDSTRPVSTVFLQHRRRIGPSPAGRHQKAILNPLGCVSVTNHRCVTTIEQYKQGSPIHYNIPADSTMDLGRVHHYRHGVCRMTRNGSRCRDAANGEVVYDDDTMLRYEDVLFTRVLAKLQLLHITHSV